MQTQPIHFDQPSGTFDQSRAAGHAQSNFSNQLIQTLQPLPAPPTQASHPTVPRMQQKESNPALFKRRRDHSKAARSKSKKYPQYAASGPMADYSTAQALHPTVPHSAISNQSGMNIQPPRPSDVLQANSSFYQSKKKIKVRTTDKNQSMCLDPNQSINVKEKGKKMT